MSGKCKTLQVHLKDGEVHHFSNADIYESTKYPGNWVVETADKYHYYEKEKVDKAVCHLGKDMTKQ